MNPTRRMGWLVIRIVAGLIFGAVATNHTGWWGWIPLGGVAGAFSQFALYGTRNYFRR